MKKIDIKHLSQARNTTGIDLTRFVPFDVADYLRSEDDMTSYLNAMQEDGSEIDIAIAIQDIARARARLNFKIKSQP